ncbi:MAG: IclR family transcriptional regulator [Rubrobacter sp.]|nr:IclR family transcriptional regulator [Rubrobacter sp.]
MDKNHVDSVGNGGDGGRYSLSSVSSAVRVLCAFTPTEPELGVSELARRLGLGKSTVHRLLSTLSEGNLIERNPQTGRYRLGLKIYELGTVVSSRLNLHEAVAMHIDGLRDLTGETVHVGILDGAEVVYVERRESPHTLRLFGEVGHRNLAHCTSTGKVLLASIEDEALDEILKSAALEAKTPHTMTDPDELRREMEEIREQGFAVNMNEAEVGVASIAAPIRDSSGKVIAAISVAGPTLRFQQDALGRLTSAVVRTAKDISARLGHSVFR